MAVPFFSCVAGIGFFFRAESGGAHICIRGRMRVVHGESDVAGVQKEHRETDPRKKLFVFYKF